jgi:uncharacterized glyoxalase superfamily protein PhnB
MTEVTECRLKLYPKNFRAARAFYEHTLGFTVLNEWDRSEHDKGAMFKVGPAVLELLTPEEAYPPITGAGLSLEVPNVHILWEELQTKAPVIFAIRDNSWGDTSFCIADPEGFELTFFTKKTDPNA